MWSNEYFINWRAETRTFFSNIHDKFTKGSHKWGHKASLNKFQQMGITEITFLDHKAIKW